MRVESWNPNAFDESFENVAIERLVEAAEVVASETRRRCPVGTTSHPMFKTGRFAGKAWTSRDAGRLKASIRVVRKRTRGGKAFSRKRSVRVYAGHYMAYYARIVEYYQAFMRPGVAAAMSEVKTIIGAK